jgi:hypothetical protein
MIKLLIMEKNKPPWRRSLLFKTSGAGGEA